MSVEITALGDAPVDLTSFDGGLGLTQPYDPNFTYCTVTARGDLTIAVPRICSQVLSDPNKVEKISLVVGTWQSHAKWGQKPVINEEGGIDTHGIPNGSCVLVGGSDGYPARGRDVMRVFYNNTRANAQHAVVQIAPGSLFSIGRREGHGRRIVAIYKVDNITTPASHILKQLKEAKRKFASTKYPTAINASLVALRIYENEEMPRGYNREESEDYTPPYVDLLLTRTLEKLSGQSFQPIFVENFYAVNTPARRRTAEYEVPEGAGTTVMPVPAEDFYSTLVREVINYRRLLKDAGEKTAQYALPMKAYLRFSESDPNAIDLHVVIPRRFSEADSATMDAIDIRTTLEGSIPEDLIQDSDLTLGKDRFEDLAALIEQMTASPDITSCHAYIKSHV